MYTKAPRIAMLAHGTSGSTVWQSDSCMACQVLAAELASTRLRNLHRPGSDANVAGKTASMTQHRLFLQLPWRVPYNTAPGCQQQSLELPLALHEIS